MWDDCLCSKGNVCGSREARQQELSNNAPAWQREGGYDIAGVKELSRTESEHLLFRASLAPSSVLSGDVQASHKKNAKQESLSVVSKALSALQSGCATGQLEIAFTKALGHRLSIDRQLSTTSSTIDVDRQDSSTKEYARLLASVFTFKGYIPQCERRCITVTQLRSVASFAREQCLKWHVTAAQGNKSAKKMELSVAILNMYHLNDWLIKPATAEHDCAFVELLSASAKVPKWFVSHWWGERVVEMAACIELHIEVRVLYVDSTFWVCAFAHRMNSWSLEDPRQASFVQAMKLSKGMLLILGGSVDGTGPATAFRRLWCMFEGAMALSNEDRDSPLLLDVASYHEGSAHLLTDGIADADFVEQNDSIRNTNSSAKSTTRRRGYAVLFDTSFALSTAVSSKTMREASFPLHVLEAGLKVQLQTAHVSDEVDRRRILNSLTSQEPDLTPLEKHKAYTLINQALGSVFAAYMVRQAIDQGKLELESWNLMGVMAADRQRHTLVLELGCCVALTDHHMKLLAAGLPANLQVLHLGLENCVKISDKGIIALANRMPNSLQVFRLDLRRCSRVSDKGFSALVEVLPLTLSHLRLRCGYCQITDAGVIALASSLQGNLRELTVSIEPNKNITSKAVEKLCKQIPSTVEVLCLGLNDCIQVDNHFTSALGKKLSNLLHLVLGLCGTKIGNTGMSNLANCLPSTLLTFQFYGENCSAIGDAGIHALRKRLPDRLQGLLLFFSHCHLISTNAIIALVDRLEELSSIEELMLDFRSCGLICDIFESVQDFRAWQELPLTTKEKRSAEHYAKTEFKAYCDRCNVELTVGLNWYHCAESDHDLCSEHWEQLGDKEKHHYINISSPAALGHQEDDYRQCRPTVAKKSCCAAQ